MSDIDPHAGDPIVQNLEKKIWAFLNVKARYPILVEAAKEIDALRERPDLRERHGNSLVIQLLRDCYDMLVIDLFSIREGLTERKGFFDLLKQSPSRLHVRPATSYGDEQINELITKGLRKAQTWLIGTDGAANAETIATLTSRFRKETEPLDEDRNRVRAHRYENRGKDEPRALRVPDLGTQIDIMWNYLHKAYLVLTNTDYSKDLHKGDAIATALDLADVAVLGSINNAVTYYGMAKETRDNPRPWYWHARRETLGGSTD